MHATLIKYVDVVQRYDDVIWKKFDITNALKMDEETELSSEISALHQDFSEQTQKNFYLSGWAVRRKKEYNGGKTRERRRRK